VQAQEARRRPLPRRPDVIPLLAAERYKPPGLAASDTRLSRVTARERRGGGG
jgi:hypothetical protein